MMSYNDKILPLSKKFASVLGSNIETTYEITDNIAISL